MLQPLIDSLDRLHDSLEQGSSGARSTFHFGARLLTVTAQPGGERWLPESGLVAAADDAGAGIPLHIIDAEQAAELEFPVGALLGPYGAFLDAARTHWLVIRADDTGRVLALNTKTRTALYYPGSAVPPRERAEFCRPLLHWLAILDGNVVVHAGAVSDGRNGLLVAGAGNAGKSTLVRACVAAGMDFLGDNVVEVGGGALFPVYPTVKVRPGGVLPIPDSWQEPEWDDEARKHIAFLGGVPGWGLTSGARDHAATLVLDAEGGGEIVALASSRAFFQVAPNTVAQFPFFEDLVLSRTREVIAAAPSFTAGRLPVDRIAGSVRDLLASTTSVGVPRWRST